MKELEDFMRALNGIENPTIQELKSAIETIDFTDDFISTHLTEPNELPYGRNIIWVTDHIQAAIIHLPAYTETFIHDHGDSVGCALVLEGNLMNTIYRLDDQHLPREVSRCLVNRNDFFYATKYQVHKMSNLNLERAISFHVYSPSIHGARTYKPASKAVLTT
ncbi:hypothetical protein E0485_06570 [Paenibacillus albiflavus]|uniref:Cysteine dioxygenase n=1 Tax=Paenibacillus albiflavus TaxID=2545760 RepID=A0A4R4EHR9_9BACL|nr:cysteine dioxygenase family protein [Paenibacillus albiflavus]TCZ78740.1 hypothetical protein E0485_06570 [Paenibacillus albiflavus]